MDDCTIQTPEQATITLNTLLQNHYHTPPFTESQQQVNNYLETPFTTDELALVKQAIDYGADVNSAVFKPYLWPFENKPAQFTLLSYAICFGHHDLARLLIAAGADVNDSSSTTFKKRPIHFCNDSTLFGELLAANTLVNYQDNDGNTQLNSTIVSYIIFPSTALQKNQCHMNWLILYGADPMIKNKRGISAFDYADHVARRDPDVGKKLISMLNGTHPEYTQFLRTIAKDHLPAAQAIRDRQIYGPWHDTRHAARTYARYKMHALPASSSTESSAPAEE